MIGVHAEAADHNVVCEFFELFKTPWEFARQDRHYEVLLHSGDGRPEASGKLVLVYAGRKVSFDQEQEIRPGRDRSRLSILSYLESQIPIYGESVTFPAQGSQLLTREDSKECAAYLSESQGTVTARIGYDLFAEVRSLLTVGQPAANASLPALELHIALLRDLIIACGVSLVEVPPVPDGHQFVVCLTHDVDHPSIRQHQWDHTMFGFLSRALFASVLRVFRGQLSIRGLLRNWTAAFELPLVHLGWVPDFWRDFADRYLELEAGKPSTFFVIPFADRAGRTPDGAAPALRASRYGAQYLAETLGKLQSADCEIGLHGIDGWTDSALGRQELEEVRRLAGASAMGVRMHWLYYSQQSAAKVEAAGAAYDSTIGYNDTIGYRAGTTQVYKPLDANRMLELPLHAMDTAMFYPSYLNLSINQARMRLRQLGDNAVRFGGTLTINWHDRSIAPERLWSGCYRDLIQDLGSRGAWFATAGQAVAWFQKRRRAAFVTDSIERGAVRAKVAVDHGDRLPGLRLRIHKSRNPSEIGYRRCDDYVDMIVEENVEPHVPFEAVK
jgi:hypothetical protein